jgi:hypothetical protein
MRDITDNLDLKRAISPQAARTDNTAIVSTVADLLGYDGVMLAIDLGANTDTDATFTVLIEDSDNNSSYAAVDDAYLNGTEALAGFTAASDDNKLKKIGYTGIKRYLRATITPAANDSGNIFLAAEWVLRPLRVPAANPPV